MAEAKIIYRPEGGSRREWLFDFENPNWEIHKMAPKAAGFRGWVPFAQALRDWDADAWQALVWVFRKIGGEPQLTLASVRFPTGLIAEIDLAAKCRACGEWVSTEDDGEHTCPEDDADTDDADTETETEGESDPEA